MKPPLRYEEEIITIAVLVLIIVFLYMLVSQIVGESTISAKDATATAYYFQQLTARP